MSRKRGRSCLGCLIRVPLAVLLLCALVVVVPNAFEFLYSSLHIKSAQALEETSTEYDAIVVLGASVNEDGTPSDVLRERLDTAIELYVAGVAPKIIMSGDDQSDADYDEVTAMKSYAVACGVPSEDVFCDHAGVCTYDSMYRARYVFEAENLLVVTQTYHLYRAVFDANFLGMEATGVPCDAGDFQIGEFFNLREVAARISDFAKVFAKAQAEYLSEPVSLDQSGDVTSW